MNQVEAFQNYLSSISPFPLEIKINDNRTTMINVLGRRKNTLRLSLHRMFLFAEDTVLKAIVNYISRRKLKSSNVILQDYINRNLKNFNYTNQLKKSDLIHQGDVFNLKDIFSTINHSYFNNELDLNITWFGHIDKKPKSHITFGLYHEPLKLIKINRLLDSERCPNYFIDYVVFHEMLHEIHRPYVDEKGISRVHSKEFVHREKTFKYYHQAKSWEKKNRSTFFK